MEKDSFSNMANFISELRKGKNLTQKELADRLGVTDKAVSKWERGKSYPDITLFPKLAEILGVSIGDFFAGKKTEKSSDDENEIVENALLYADVVTKDAIAKSAQSKALAIALVGLIVIAGITYVNRSLLFNNTNRMAFPFTLVLIIIAILIGSDDSKKIQNRLDSPRYDPNHRITLLLFDTGTGSPKQFHC